MKLKKMTCQLYTHAANLHDQNITILNNDDVDNILQRYFEITRFFFRNCIIENMT